MREGMNVQIFRQRPRETFLCPQKEDVVLQNWVARVFSLFQNLRVNPKVNTFPSPECVVTPFHCPRIVVLCSPCLVGLWVLHDQGCT